MIVVLLLIIDDRSSQTLEMFDVVQTVSAAAISTSVS